MSRRLEARSNENGGRPTVNTVRGRPSLDRSRSISATSCLVPHWLNRLVVDVERCLVRNNKLGKPRQLKFRWSVFAIRTDSPRCNAACRTDRGPAPLGPTPGIGATLTRWGQLCEIFLESPGGVLTSTSVRLDWGRPMRSGGRASSPGHGDAPSRCHRDVAAGRGADRATRRRGSAVPAPETPSPMSVGFAWAARASRLGLEVRGAAPARPPRQREARGTAPGGLMVGMVLGFAAGIAHVLRIARDQCEDALNATRPPDRAAGRGSDGPPRDIGIMAATAPAEPARPRRRQHDAGTPLGPRPPGQDPARVRRLQVTRFMVMEAVAAALMAAIVVPLARHVARRPVIRGPFFNAFEAGPCSSATRSARPAIGGHGDDAPPLPPPPGPLSPRTCRTSGRCSSSSCSTTCWG